MNDTHTCVQTTLNILHEICSLTYITHGYLILMSTHILYLFFRVYPSFSSSSSSRLISCMYIHHSKLKNMKKIYIQDDKTTTKKKCIKMQKSTGAGNDISFCHPLTLFFTSLYRCTYDSVFVCM